MSILEPVQQQRTAEDGARQIRQTFQNTFRQMEAALRQVRDIVGRYGRPNIDKALGGDAKQFANLYSAVKEFIQKHKAGAVIDDLPK
jgi:hypothetical protein